MKKKLRIKNNLRKYRIWKNVTQKQLAKEIEISTNTIRNIEKYWIYPNYMVRKRICNCFNVSQDQMFYLD